MSIRLLQAFCISVLALSASAEAQTRYMLREFLPGVPRTMVAPTYSGRVSCTTPVEGRSYTDGTVAGTATVNTLADAPAQCAKFASASVKPNVCSTVKLSSEATYRVTSRIDATVVPQSSITFGGITYSYAAASCTPIP